VKVVDGVSFVTTALQLEMRHPRGLQHAAQLLTSFVPACLCTVQARLDYNAALQQMLGSLPNDKAADLACQVLHSPLEEPSLTSWRAFNAGSCGQSLATVLG